MPQRYRKPSVSGAYPEERRGSGRWAPYVALPVFLFIVILILTASPVPSAKEAKKKISQPFGPAVHKPPIPTKETTGEAKWFSDWKWLNPFSDSITSDEEKSVLPHLRKRPPIYAFYDTSADRNEATRAAENKLLLIWRRAWWAQGFKPVILGRAEAMNNPLYQRAQSKTLDAKLETEVMRWLAWEQMGGGILANWLVLPMGPHEDNLLSFLRRGEYPKLARYEGLGLGLYSGNKEHIETALSHALASEKLPKAKSVTEQFPREAFKVEPKPASIAFYDGAVLSEHYKSISTSLAEDKPAGLRSLAELITSHLHVTFLNTFPIGFAILTPHPAYTLTLSQPALSIAHSLAACPESPIPSSCPPNHQSCTPCSTSKPVPIDTLASFYNTSSLYTIATLPHPYTLTSLLSPDKDISIRHIRRDTDRDRWLQAVTEVTLGKDISGPSRIVSFKETVASDWGSARGLWMTEDPPVPEHKDLEWHFGFALPFVNNANLIPTKQRPSEKESKQQSSIIEKSRRVLSKKRKKGDMDVRTKDAVEAWNLADAEAWRFVRALGARETLKRKEWEAKEKKFAGGEKDEGRGQGWGRWFDR